MFTFLSNYFTKQKFKQSETLCSLATILILDQKEGIKLLTEYSKEEVLYHKILTNILDKNIKDVQEQALEVYKQAALICPENSDPSWRIIEILHHKGRNDEAFTHYSKMLNHKIDAYGIAYTTPTIAGMLISVGQKEKAIDLVAGVLYKFSAEQNHSSKDAFLSSLLWEVLYLTIERINDYIDLIRNIDQSLMIALAKNIALKARPYINDDNLKEALAWIDIAIGVNPDNQEFLNIKREIEQDLKEGTTWDSIKSEDDFFHYLYRRLVHRFHPDLAKHDNERMEKTKIMSEINKARSNNNLQELKIITQKHAPNWVKYFRF